MNAIVYKCPHCEEEIEIAESLIDTDVKCSNCGKPFHVEAPSAEPLRQAEGGEGSERAEKQPEVAPTGLQEEQVVMTERPALIRSNPGQSFLILLLLVGGVAGLVASGIEWYTQTFGAQTLIYGGLTLIAAALIWLLVLWIEILMVKLEITTQRTRVIRGILARYTTEIQHDDVRTLEVNQSLLQRLLMIGNFGVSSAGEAGVEIRVKNLPNPNVMADTIRQYQTIDKA